MNAQKVLSPPPSWIQSNFRALLDAAPDAMLVGDEHGSIVFANLKTEHLFGYSGSELLGQKVEVLVPPCISANHPGHRAGHLTEHQCVHPMSADPFPYGCRKDGSEFPVEISLSPIDTPDGKMVIRSIRDVSERKLAEAQIRKLNNELERALRRSDKLAITGRQVATLAHEINNPLDSLTNVLHLLGSNLTLDDSGKELVAIARQELGRLSNLSQETLAPHRETKLPVVTKISELLDIVLATLRRRLEASHIEVRHEYHTEGEVTIYPSELRQAFTNLISNALDAMNDYARLSLSTERLPDNEIVVRIGDTGCGIPAENLGAIFDPFFTTKGENGTGIGLWVTKSIVENVGGRIEVTSSTTGNKGTCFSIYLSTTTTLLAESHVDTIDAESAWKRKTA